MEWKCGARCAVCLPFDFGAHATTIVAFPVLGTEPVDNVELLSTEITHQFQ